MARINWFSLEADLLPGADVPVEPRREGYAREDHEEARREVVRGADLVALAGEPVEVRVADPSARGAQARDQRHHATVLGAIAQRETIRVAAQ